MPLDSILFMGGSGAIGQHTARALRAVHPDVPLLIGGRDLARAQQAAEQIGGALGVAIDPKADDLGLGDRPISAVVVFYMDHALAGLRYAQTQGVPHLSISSGIFEIAPEIATYMHRPDAAPIVLGYEWMVAQRPYRRCTSPRPLPGYETSLSTRWWMSRTAEAPRSPRISST